MAEFLPGHNTEQKLPMAEFLPGHNTEQKLPMAEIFTYPLPTRVQSPGQN
jgi:hypothetical protein